MNQFAIRPVAVDERRAAHDAFRAAYLFGAISDEFAAETAQTWDAGHWLGAWDGDRCVANGGALTFDTTVPGGAQLPTAGFSRIGVIPTHTRRGILTEMMDRGLREARERGQVLASLRASEAPIYGRFGFGLAGNRAAVHVTSARAKPLRCKVASGTFRLLAYHEVADVVPPVYERVARRRVGTIGRPPWMWKRYLKGAATVAESPDSPGESVVVHTNDDGVDDGYVHYSTSWVEQFGAPHSGTGEVFDLWGADDGVELALWSYLFDIDLVQTWNAEERPVDDAIQRPLFDVRAHETRQIHDEQWLRLLDVDAALSARTYAATPAAVTVAVNDPGFADNCGTWTIGEDGATASDAAPDVTVDIATLSAAYLGGVPWRALASSGLLVGCDPSMLTKLDALFGVYPAPFCGSGF